jgi:hypothetical protein
MHLVCGVKVWLVQLPVEGFLADANGRGCWWV